MPRIVVVEDERSIAQAIVARLRSEGFEADAVHDGFDAVEFIGRIKPDLVVLDLMLPGLDGVEVCRRIHPTPVLMLTAKTDEADVLVGLAVGADDYMTKPFSPRELVARIRTILRRIERGTTVDENPSVVRIGGVELDPVTRTVTSEGESVHLTPTEFDLLACLGSKPGRVFTRDELLGEVWGYRDGYGSRTVDSHVRAVRQKVGASVIRTVHGVGYASAAG
ncbi:MAG TPA: response regulator transcription factor [Acidimicrobiales bacterium]